MTTTPDDPSDDPADHEVQDEAFEFANTPTPTIGTDVFGIPFYPLRSAIALRDIHLLRLLGRLEYLTTTHIRRMVYPDMHGSMVFRRLKSLANQGVIWSEKVAYAVLEDTDSEPLDKPMKLPLIWMLTPLGRDTLADADVEHDARSVHGLKTHDPAVKLPQLNLTHDLAVSSWLASLIQAVRGNAFCQSMFAQVEFITTPEQRLDALVILRITPGKRREVTHEIPWYAGEPRQPGEVEVRLALEMDRDTEAVKVIGGKAKIYRDLTGTGVYTELFGGPVLPIFIAPYIERMRDIAASWTSVWPDTWGVISTLEASYQSRYGTLWGNYVRLNQRRTVLPLLSEIRVDSRGVVQIVRVMSLEQWEQGYAPPM